MQNDVTPGGSRRPQDDSAAAAADNDTSHEISSVSNEEQPANGQPSVSEQKIEQEFGPPPMTSPAKTTKPPLHKRPKHWFQQLSTSRKIVYGLLLLLAIAVGVFVWQ